MHLAWRNCNHRFLLTVLILFSLFFFLGLLFLRKKKEMNGNKLVKNTCKERTNYNSATMRLEPTFAQLAKSYLSNMFHVFRMCSFGQNVQQPIHSFMWERGSVLDKGLKTAHRKKKSKLVKKKFSLLASFEMYRVQHGGNAKWSYGVRVKKRSARDLSIKTEVISSPSHLLA